MLKQIATIAKTKLWFATVNKYRGMKARSQLAEYVSTLSPEQQAWANDLRARLDAAKTPEQSVGILRGEAAKIGEKQMRLAEKLHSVTSVTN